MVNTHFTAGDGVSKPSGVMTEATLGVTAASATEFTADELIDLEHSVDRAYRRNARLMMNDDALRVVKKLKDGAGRYLWLASPADGEPDTILGHAYTINQDVPAIAPSAKSILFGDFSKYYIRRITGARVLRLVERYADYNQIAFVAFQRWDGALIDAGTHPVKYLQMHSLTPGQLHPGVGQVGSVRNNTESRRAVICSWVPLPRPAPSYIFKSGHPAPLRRGNFSAAASPSC